MTRAWRDARARGYAPEIRRLHRPNLARSCGAAAADWVLIFAAFAAVLKFAWWAVPVALLVIGNRQRALANLLHDASHGGFAGRGAKADFCARLVLYLPLCNAIATYRRDHFAHHQQLGVPGEDVDFIHSETDRGKPWYLLLGQFLADPNIWAGSVLGHLRRSGTGERRWMLLWWAVFLATLSLALTPHAALVFLALWIAARATVFHLITTFREISDHVGLVPGTLIGFSRNQVSHGLLTQFFHPHNNGYHLVHHLFPGLPYYTWPQVHQLLLGWPDYAAATHCTHYFGGADSLTQSWTHPAASAAPRGQFWHVA